MGGPPLWEGRLLNIYTGGSEPGPRRVLVRAAPAVATVRVDLSGEEPALLRPVAERRDRGVVFFAALLPRAAVVDSVTALDAAGHELEQPGLSHHEEGWQRFRRRLALASVTKITGPGPPRAVAGPAPHGRLRCGTGPATLGTRMRMGWHALVGDGSRPSRRLRWVRAGGSGPG